VSSFEINLILSENEQFLDDENQVIGKIFRSIFTQGKFSHSKVTLVELRVLRHYLVYGMRISLGKLIVITENE
jgi:hypothetical protein